MATSKLSGTYRGFRFVEVVDAQGQPTGKVEVTGLDRVFTSLESAKEAINAKIETDLVKEQSAPKPEPEPAPALAPPRMRPSP